MSNGLAGDAWGVNLDGMATGASPGKFAQLARRLELFLAAGCTFFAPYNVFRLEAFYFTLSDAFACACLVTMVARGTLPLRPLGNGTALWFSGAMLMISSIMLSSIVYGDPLRGLVVFGQYFFACVLLPFILVGRAHQEVTVLVKFLVAGITLACLHGIYLSDIAGVAAHTRFISGSGRLLGVVERANEFSYLIGLTLPLLFWLANTGEVSRFLFWLVLPVLMYGTILTGSNSGLASACYAIVAYVVLARSWKKILGAGAALGVFFFAMVTAARDYLPEVFQRRVLSALESGSVEDAGTFSSRMDLITEAMEMANDTLLLGYGADQYRVISASETPVHNFYLLMWVEGGILTLIGFAIMMLGGLSTLSARPSGTRGSASIVCVATSASLFLLVINAVPHIYARFFIIPLLLAFATATTARRLER